MMSCCQMKFLTEQTNIPAAVGWMSTIKQSLHLKIFKVIYPCRPSVIQLVSILVEKQPDFSLRLLKHKREYQLLRNPRLLPFQSMLHYHLVVRRWKQTIQALYLFQTGKIHMLHPAHTTTSVCPTRQMTFICLTFCVGPQDIRLLTPHRKA